MSSQTSYGSSVLFQSINDDLSASLATADELSKEFNSLLQGVSTNNNNTYPASQSIPTIITDEPQYPEQSSRNTTGESGGNNNNIHSPLPPFSPSTSSSHSLDSFITSNQNVPSSPYISRSISPLSSPKIRTAALPQVSSDSHLYGLHSLRQAPPSPKQRTSSMYDRVPPGSSSYMERSPSPSPTTSPFDNSPRSASFHPSLNLLSPYDTGSMGRRSPRPDRSPSPISFNHPMSNTLPRNFMHRHSDEGVQPKKSPSKWNETDLDMSYERKPHHTYDKTEWLRPSVPNSNWRESDLDGPPPARSPKMDRRSKPHQYSHGSLPRNVRLEVTPDVLSPTHSPYNMQPIVSRISIPPTSVKARQHKPIPLSVIMRLQNPHWGGMMTGRARAAGEADQGPYLPVMPMPREFFNQPHFPQQLFPPELRQPGIYSDALNPGDIDAELERLDFAHRMPAIVESPGSAEGDSKPQQGSAPRPLSPTRLQPVVAPEAQDQVITEELLRIRSQIPRALKRRGSVDYSQPLKHASHYQPNQYKTLIDKLFRQKEHSHKGEQGSDHSSSDGEDCAMPPALPPQTSSSFPHDLRGYHSILRNSKERKSTGRRARLSPLVLALDGALVGELETVQKAIQEMSDPSQPNDEGITALHNGICGGHYNVVDFLVRSGANVSAPDSHGWTPLHCAASCNDRNLCEFLVRNGAAVVAMTQSDGATASQKCDPYAVGFEECESFLRGVEEAMGVENSGVLYALWSYPSQAADELSFKDGDMVTILQKPEGSDWWWASLFGREGFVPSNYFGLFPKVRPKSLC